MFKSFWAQVTLYKWIIIVVLISLLALGLGWQYHRASILETKTTALEDKNKELNDSLTIVSTQFDTYKKRTDKALEDVELLRHTFAEISGDTQALKARLGRMETIKPTPGGANAKEIENEANAFMDRVFKRMEAASKGKTTE